MNVMANTNAEVVRPPDRADWMSCDHGFHWEMRELCAVCAEASVIAYASTQNLIWRGRY